jgi:hypothetical protein
MPRSKSFSSLNVAAPEALEFDLNGHIWHCSPMVPGAALLDFAAELNAEDPKAMATAVWKFFDLALSEQEQEQFKTFVRDPEQRVDISTLMSIAEWLMEQFMGEVPLAQAVPSTAG